MGLTDRADKHQDSGAGAYSLAGALEGHYQNHTRQQEQAAEQADLEGHGEGHPAWAARQHRHHSVQ